MPVGEPRKRAEAEAHELALKLKQFCVEQGVPAREMSQRIGRAPEYLTRVFAGRHTLKIKDVFRIFAALQVNPRRFLFRHYPLGGAELSFQLDPQRLATLPGGEMLARMIEVHLLGGPPMEPMQTVERAGRILRGLIARSATKQRAVARELDVADDALGQALRGRTGLAAWHVFGILAATQTSPARFFHELTAPEDPVALGAEEWSRIVRLAEGVGAPAEAAPTQEQDGSERIARRR